jgi:hypothetical protein
MLDGPTPEREEELIEIAAQYIVRHDLEDFAAIAIEGTAPFGDIVGELGVMMSYPLAVTFFNRSGADFVNMLGFNYQVNAERILKRVEQLAKEKKIRQEKIKELEKLRRQAEGRQESWFSRLLLSLGIKKGTK